MKKRVFVLLLALLMVWPTYPGCVPAVNAVEATEAPTETPEMPTDMPEAVTEMPETATETLKAATETPEAVTETPETPTDTPEVPTETPEVPTETPVPEENHRHQASCAAPNICVQCGEPCAVTEKDLLHSGEKAFAANTIYHWYIWTCCGGTAYDENGDVPLESHWYSCTAPDVCAVCGFAGCWAGGDSVEHDWSDWQSDENSHWRVCLRCGEKTETTPHSAACDRPSVCVECGTSGTMAYTIDHVYDMTHWQSDENAHWRECTRCGEKSNLSPHWAACDQPSVCAECGAAGHMAYLAGHIYDESVWFSDETAHWQECTRCGQKTSLALHWAPVQIPIFARFAARRAQWLISKDTRMHGRTGRRTKQIIGTFVPCAERRWIPKTHITPTAMSLKSARCAAQQGL